LSRNIGSGRFWITVFLNIIHHIKDINFWYPLKLQYPIPHLILQRLGLGVIINEVMTFSMFRSWTCIWTDVLLLLLYKFLLYIRFNFFQQLALFNPLIKNRLCDYWILIFHAELKYVFLNLVKNLSIINRIKLPFFLCIYILLLLLLFIQHCLIKILLTLTQFLSL